MTPDVTPRGGFPDRSPALRAGQPAGSRLPALLARANRLWDDGAATDRVAAAAVLLFAAYFSVLGLGRYLTFQFGGDWFKLASSLYNTSQARPFRNAVDAATGYYLWQEHLGPVFAVFLPVYRFAGPAGDVAIIVAQAACAGAAGWLCYQLARLWLPRPGHALLVMFVLFASAKLQIALVHDVHELTFLPLFFFLAFLGAARGNDRMMWLGFLGGLLVREDTFLALAGLPLYLLWSERRWRTAAAMFGCIAVYQGLLFGVIFPALRHGRPYAFLGHYAWLANSFGDLAALIVTHPLQVLGKIARERDNTALGVFLSLYFGLPLTTIGGWLAILPSLSQTLLSNVPHVISYRYHYVVPPLCAMTVGTTLALRFWGWRASALARGRDVTTAALAVLLVYNLAFAHLYGAQPFSRFVQSPGVRFNRAKVDKVLSAQRLLGLIPAAAQRALSTNLFGRYHADERVALFQGSEHVAAAVTHLLLDTENPHLEFGTRTTENIVDLLTTGPWRIMSREGSLVLLRRAAD